MQAPGDDGAPIGSKKARSNADANSDYDSSDDDNSDGSDSDSSDAPPLQARGAKDLVAADFAPAEHPEATIKKMREWLADFGLRTNGKKYQLQARLYKHLMRGAHSQK